MAQPKQWAPKRPAKTQQSPAGSNLLFAIAVLAVAGGGVFLFMRSGSSQPTPVTEASDASTSATSTAPDAALATASSAAESPAEQPAAAIPTALPKKRPPSNAEMPPISLGNYSPARPVDQVRDAHHFAAQYPDVSQYIPCFCGCEALGHQGNDDCFVRARDAEGRVTAWEPHGVSCEVCIDVANESRRMHASGASVTQIRSAIEKRYRPLAKTMTPTPMPPSMNK